MLSNYIKYGEPINSWTLLRCIWPHKDIRPGQWVLVYSMFLDEEVPRVVPSIVFDDFPLHDDEDEDAEKFLERILDFEKSMKMDPQTGYGFYACCMQAGYNPFEEDFYLWVAERLLDCVLMAQENLTPVQLKSLLNMLVELESYEKAALVRDVLDGKKHPQKIF